MKRYIVPLIVAIVSVMGFDAVDLPPWNWSGI